MYNQRIFHILRNFYVTSPVLFKLSLSLIIDYDMRKWTPLDPALIESKYHVEYIDPRWRVRITAEVIIHKLYQGNLLERGGKIRGLDGANSSIRLWRIRKDLWARTEDIIENERWMAVECLLPIGPRYDAIAERMMIEKRKEEEELARKVKMNKGKGKWWEDRKWPTKFGP